ncbi:MAG: hypothetical protein ABSD78_17180 [Acidimicrobiales bacterium]
MVTDVEDDPTPLPIELAELRRRWPRWASVVCVACYVGLGFLANLPVWIHGPTTVLQCGGCGDVGQEVWFLRWPASALAHGRNPLFSSFLNVPIGVNLTDNTSMPLVGVVSTPLSWLIGPIATFSLMLSLGFASSATAFFFAARRFVSSVPAAFVGGLLYSFSPFMIGQGRGHLFLVIGLAAPLAVICLDEILSGGRRGLLAGAGLGVLAGAQLLISVEVLLIFTLVGGIGVAVVVTARHKTFRSEPRRVAAAFGLAAGVFALVSAYPAYMALAGPGHLAGPIHPLGDLSRLSTAVAGVVVPGPNERFSLGFGSTSIQWVRMAAQGGPGSGDAAENGGYIGLPLLLLLIVGVTRYRSDRVVQLFTGLGLVSLVLSLGSRLHLAGRFTSIPLPFALLTRIPLVKSEVAVRYSVAMWLCIAFLSARLLDRWLGDRRRRRSASGEAQLVSGGAVCVVMVLSAIALLPAWPYPTEKVLIPSWFSSKAAAQVPYGTTVLTYPFPRKPHSEAMVWQAVDGIRYRIPAGEAVVSHTRFSATETVFDACLSAGVAPALNARRIGLMRGDLTAFGISTVVIPTDIPHWICAARAIELVLGRPPVPEYGAEVWSSDHTLLPIGPVARSAPSS